MALEVIAFELFEDLARSFFELLNGNIFTLHNMVHELAQFITEHEVCSSLDLVELKNIPPHKEANHIFIRDTKTRSHLMVRQNSGVTWKFGSQLVVRRNSGVRQWSGGGLALAVVRRDIGPQVVVRQNVERQVVVRQNVGRQVVVRQNVGPQVVVRQNVGSQVVVRLVLDPASLGGSTELQHHLEVRESVGSLGVVSQKSDVSRWSGGNPGVTWWSGGSTALGGDPAEFQT
ncbi:hypothetical protein M5K25_013727 [Dendrobium thyrsiflorum]|uniref:Uncharacterized protein n=1 Tax=Dendrobium thyrsiflorum TaxID=117978 RepID=A0ABD0UTK7_DENTH